MRPGMTRQFCTALSLVLFGIGSPLRAANKSVAKESSETKIVWTNDDLERLRAKGFISIIGRVPEEPTESVQPDAGYTPNEDPRWYAAQATKLQSQLERRQRELQRYREALQDARDLKTTTGGINLVQGDIGITPQAAVEILEGRVQETKSKLDELEDLARHKDIPPGILRGR